MEARPPIRAVLEHYGADFNSSRGYGVWRSICCPFHEDRTPSGRVNEESDVFACFVCDIAGDSWLVIMDREGVRFPEAKRLAETLFNFKGGDVQRPARRGKQYRPSWT
jgi:DNA primase